MLLWQRCKPVYYNHFTGINYPLSPPTDTSIYIDANTRIQILETMLLLPTADKEQCAAFIVRPTFLLLKQP